MSNINYDTVIRSVVDSNPDLQAHEGAGKIDEALMLLSIHLGIPLRTIAEYYPDTLETGPYAHNEAAERTLVPDRHNPMISELDKYLHDNFYLLDLR